LTLYLVASALARFDAKALSPFWVVIRLVTAVLILFKPEAIHLAAFAFAIGLLAFHHIGARRVQVA